MLTVPLTLTFCVVAPLLAQVMLPVTAPRLALAVMRAWMVLVPTVPLLGVSVSEVCQVEPLSLDSSTPVGAVTMRFAVRLLPPTVKDCAGVDAVPAVVVPKASDEVLAVTVGGLTRVVPSEALPLFVFGSTVLADSDKSTVATSLNEAGVLFEATFSSNVTTAVPPDAKAPKLAFTLVVALSAVFRTVPPAPGTTPWARLEIVTFELIGIAQDTTDGASLGPLFVNVTVVVRLLPITMEDVVEPKEMLKSERRLLVTVAPVGELCVTPLLVTKTGAGIANTVPFARLEAVETGIDSETGVPFVTVPPEIVTTCPTLDSVKPFCGVASVPIVNSGGRVTVRDVTPAGADPATVLLRFTVTEPVSPAGNVLAGIVPTARGVGTIAVVTARLPATFNVPETACVTAALKPPPEMDTFPEMVPTVPVPERRT